MTTPIEILSSPTSRTAIGQTFLVAASDSDARSRARADYVCDGSGDEVEIQYALDSLPSVGGSVQLSEGTFVIDAAIELDGLQGVELIGSGMRSTVIKPEAAASAINIIRVFGSRNCRLGNFELQSGAARPATAAIVCETKTGVSITNNRFENIYIEGTNSGGLQYGFRTITGTGGDANNDLHVLDNVQVFNYDLRAFSIEHAQSKAHLFLGCVSSSNGLGQYGVWSTGSYTWVGGGCNDVTTSAFFQNAANDYVTIISPNCELRNGELFYQTGGPAGTGMPQAIINARVDYPEAGKTPADDGAADGRVIDAKLRGDFHINGIIVASTDFASLTFRFQQSDLSFAIAENVTFKTSASDPFEAGTWIRRGIHITATDNTVSKFVLENSGTATLANGTTSIAVTHGLSLTPSAGDLMVHPIETLNSASYWWVDTLTSTQFTINVNADPGQDVDFAWRAKID